MPRTLEKILVIDDDPGFAQMLTEYLKSSGFEASLACNLEEAIDVFRKEKPKVVILDFRMPIVTGEKFLPILQSVDPLVRTIVITGCIEEDVREKFKGLGYFAFFEKGKLSLEEVRRKVKEALDG